MYQAYVIEEVVSKLPFDASFFAPYNKKDKLFIASKVGRLVSCARSTDGKRGFEYQVSRNFEKRSILELKVVESHDLILCLTSDSQIAVHSAIEPFSLIENVYKYRPITAFGFYVKKESNLLLLAISARKRIYLFKWLANSFDEEPIATSTCLPDNAQKLSWCGENALVLVIKSEYFFFKLFADESETYNTDLGKACPLFSCNLRNAETPIIVDMPDKEMVALRRDDFVVFYDFGGNSLSECLFSDHPISIAYDSPYLIAILPDNIIEVRTIQPSQMVQKIQLDGASSLCAGQTGCVYVGGDHSSWLLNSKPLLRANVKFLMEMKQFELAIQLARQHRELVDSATFVEINRRMAYNLFAEKRFAECFNIHLEIGTDVILVLNFLQNLIPEKWLTAVSKYSATELSLFESAYATLTENQRKAAVIALGDYLSAKRTEVAKLIATHYKNYREDRKQDMLSTKDLKKYGNILELVDTALLKCYIMTKPMLVSSLLRLPDNSCITSEAEKELFSKAKFLELLILYERRNMHRKALELLKRESKTENSPLRGTARMAEYLRNLGGKDLNLIFQFAHIVFAEDVEAGIEIFTAPSESEQKRVLDHEEVLNYLKTHFPVAVVPFLEHIIFSCYEMRPRFHDMLAEEYVDRIKGLMKDYIHTLADDELLTRGGEEEGELGALRRNLMHFLNHSSGYNAEKVLSLLDDYLLEEKAIVYGRMKEHEKALWIYANILMDFDAAEKHCNLHYDTKDEVDSQVFFTLFKAYASPPELSTLEFKPKFATATLRANIAEALKILRKHAAKIDTIRAISFIPLDTPLSKVWEALEAVFEAIKNKATETSLLLSIMKVARGRYEEELKRIKSQRIVIDYAVECAVCRKKITNSAFVRQPDHSIIHFFCYKKLKNVADSTKN